MELAVKNIQGGETGRTVQLPADFFEITPNDHAIYLDVKQYLANQRQGTHKTKERGEVAFSTRKIKKQKGTGGARAGSIKAPNFRKGGTVFGPRPRDYRFKLNKKLKLLARKSALTYKARESKIVVVEDIHLEVPKTKSYLNILKNLSLDNVKTLFVSAELNKNLYLSARNLPKSHVTMFSALNTYDILNADVLVLSESAVAKFSSQNQELS
ncbi:MAG: 50S ribosomal protein L4 [Cytophagales bacterium]|nr:50S ribosomal protein L4 [Cytophagales bacterium]MDW8384365.1 50S ribosomal protein L4 [Flammeovirgaceae bacterium]